MGEQKANQDEELQGGKEYLIHARTIKRPGISRLKLLKHYPIQIRQSAGWKASSREFVSIETISICFKKTLTLIRCASSLKQQLRMKKTLTKTDGKMRNAYENMHKKYSQNIRRMDEIDKLKKVENEMSVVKRRTDQKIQDTVTEGN